MHPLQRRLTPRIQRVGDTNEQLEKLHLRTGRSILRLETLGKSTMPAAIKSQYLKSSFARGRGGSSAIAGPLKTSGGDLEPHQDLPSESEVRRNGTEQGHGVCAGGRLAQGNEEKGEKGRREAEGSRSQYPCAHHGDCSISSTAMDQLGNSRQSMVRLCTLSVMTTWRGSWHILLQRPSTASLGPSRIW